MRRLIGHDLGGYIFDPSTATVTLTGLAALTLEQVLLVTNVTRGQVLYSFADPTLGATLAPTVDGWALALTAAMDGQAASDALQIWIEIATPPVQAIETDGLAPEYVMDINLADVLGTRPLTDMGRVQTHTATRVIGRVSGVLTAINQELRLATDQASTSAIQLAGTWAGKVVFEATADGANWVALGALPSTGAVAVTTTTAGGLWLANVAGVAAIRVRCSAYTSGVIAITLIADTALIGNAVGSQTAAFPTAQSVTETLLPLLYAPAHSDADQQVVEPVTNATRPTTYAAPKFANFPQRYRRLRVEAAGSERLALAQEPYTNRLLVATPELYARIEELLVQATLTNQLLAQAFALSLPTGFAETSSYNLE